MKKPATAIALVGTPAFAADMAVKAPPPALGAWWGVGRHHTDQDIRQQPLYDTFVVDAFASKVGLKSLKP